MKTLVSASILSSNILRLGEEVHALEKNGIDMLHFDVMDGVFVNNITYGLPILKAIREITDMTLDVHLMITEPSRYVKQFAEVGADIITFHTEAENDVFAAIKAIKSFGKKAAVAIKPNTPAETVFDYLPYVDMVLVMTVEPGFGGQKFIASTVDKIKVVRERCIELGIDMDIQVDGGIDHNTSRIVTEAGANVLVSGSYLFGSADMAAAALAMKGEA